MASTAPLTTHDSSSDASRGDRLAAVIGDEIATMLDDDAIDALLEAPDGIRTMVREALSTWARAEGVMPSDPAFARQAGRAPRSPDETAALLESLVVPGPSLAELGVVGASELVRRLGLGSRQTLYDRAARGELLAFDISGARRFPLGQFDDAGNVLPGISAVIDELGNRLTTWQWLQAPSELLGGIAPLERLRRSGRSSVAEVLDAARAERYGNFA